MNDGIRGKIQLTIVVFMGLLALSLVIGALVLKTQKLDVPDSLIAIGSAAVGGLLGYLQKDIPTTSVKIDQPEDQPVPVETQ